VSPSSLESLAYRMLGSMADAQDVVQEARLRLLQQDCAPDNEQAWLFRVVTNIALDRLRTRRRQRETYPGPWLPEPVLTEAGAPDALAGLAEELSVGLLLMFERLSPLERIVFVLREGFDLPFTDIAALTDSTPASCRQRYRRARANLSGEQRFPSPPETQRALLERLMLAVAERDFDQVVALFSEDAVIYTDGGGVVSAAVRPVTEPARIAQVILHLAAKTQAQGGIEYRPVWLNGVPGLLLEQNGALHSSVQIDVRDDRIVRVYVVRNPQKLAGLHPSTGAVL